MTKAHVCQIVGISPFGFFALSSVWRELNLFSGLQSTTPTQRTYSHTNNSGNYSYSSQGTHTLSDEYTTAAFVADTIESIADYPDEWNEDYWGWGYHDWGYWGPWDYWGYDDWYYYQGYGNYWWGWWAGHWDLSQEETDLKSLIG
jgi:hypothetical protein